MAADSGEAARITNPAVMRALAHPARLAILDYLSLHDTAGGTATECATVVGLTPSATSYHLRALAKVGLIEMAPSRGDGRERIWRRRFHGSSPEGGSPAAAHSSDLAAEAAVAKTSIANQTNRIRSSSAVPQAEQQLDWCQATTLADQTLAITAQELTALLAMIDELVRPFRYQTREFPPPASQIVTLQVRAGTQAHPARPT